MSEKIVHIKLEVTMEGDSDSNYSPEEKLIYQKIKGYVKISMVWICIQGI